MLYDDSMHIYFSGIGGSGISALAHIALDAGYTVSGSDLKANRNTEELTQRGASIHLGQKKQQIEQVNQNTPIDWLIISSAIPEDSEELTFARENNVSINKREAFVQHIIDAHNLKLVAVAGTHGKTTVTTMLAWLLQQQNQPVSWVIGTNVSFGNSGHLDADSEYLILEADEYDRHMLHYHPYISVIPSLDYDHPDIYPTKQDYLNAFNQFAMQSQLMILWQSDAEKLANFDSHFPVPDNKIDLSGVPLPGEHNRKNAWLVATALERLGFVNSSGEAWSELLQRFSDFPGSERRFEELANNIFTDYAHHPTEIAAVLELAIEVKEQRHYNDIVVVYQPHQNTRQHEVKDNYDEAFKSASRIYWTPTYLSREDTSLRLLYPDDFATMIESTDVIPSDLDKKLIENLRAEKAQNNLIVVMGAGDIDEWARNNLRTI